MSEIRRTRNAQENEEAEVQEGDSVELKQGAPMVKKREYGKSSSTITSLSIAANINGTKKKIA